MSSRSDALTSRWRLKHRSELSACGIPRETTASDARWRYVLLHGDDPESGWDESWLSDDQGRQLLNLLGPFFPDPIGIELIERVQRRWGQ